MEVESRIARLCDELATGGLPRALMVSNLKNIRYLSGFTGSAGVLFVSGDDCILVTDGRYETQAAEQLSASGARCRVVIAPATDQASAAEEIASDWGIDALGLEAAHISWARQMALSESWFPTLELVPTVGLVERLRAIKDQGELDRIAEAARIADEALARVRPLLEDSPSEVEFGRRLDFEMRCLGASGPSFETIVASGPNAAKPHHRPGRRVIGPNEPVVLDFGAVFEGYCSDMTRTVWSGGLGDADLRRAVEVVAASQAAGVAAVRAGVACSDVDRACREVVEAAGWGDRFVHGTGHGVGLDIHEAPSVSASSADTLCAGQVVTVEPGVYLPGLGGVRIEDTVVVTDDGCHPLTSTAKDRP
jgi:Xaa-Pro aminopeptidase